MLGGAQPQHHLREPVALPPGEAVDPPPKLPGEADGLDHGRRQARLTVGDTHHLPPAAPQRPGPPGVKLGAEGGILPAGDSRRDRRRGPPRRPGCRPARAPSGGAGVCPAAEHQHLAEGAGLRERYGLAEADPHRAVERLARLYVVAVRERNDTPGRAALVSGQRDTVERVELREVPVAAEPVSGEQAVEEEPPGLPQQLVVGVEEREVVARARLPEDTLHLPQQHAQRLLGKALRPARTLGGRRNEGRGGSDGDSRPSRLRHRHHHADAASTAEDCPKAKRRRSLGVLGAARSWSSTIRRARSDPSRSWSSVRASVPPAPEAGTGAGSGSDATRSATTSQPSPAAHGWSAGSTTQTVRFRSKLLGRPRRTPPAPPPTQATRRSGRRPARRRRRTNSAASTFGRRRAHPSPASWPRGPAGGRHHKPTVCGSGVGTPASTACSGR